MPGASRAARLAPCLAFLACWMLSFHLSSVSASNPSSASSSDSAALKPHRILFASCFHQNLATPMFRVAARQLPVDTWIWGGDNVYADEMQWDPVEMIKTLVRTIDLPFVSGTPTTIREAYAKLGANPEYSAFLARSGAIVLATIDDHDIGTNDADESYEHKKESMVLFDEFFPLPNGAKRPGLASFDGIYSSYTAPDGSYRVLLLDNRSQRSPYSVGPLKGRMMSETQWRWLENELCGEAAAVPRVNFIVAGLQMLPEDRVAGESWSKFPNERRRLLSLLNKCKVKAPILMSGDIHMAETLQATCHPRGPPVWEITSSGLTHSWGTRAQGWSGEIPAFNAVLYALVNAVHFFFPYHYRKEVYLGLNVARLDLDVAKDVLEVAILGASGEVAIRQTLKLSELDMKGYPEEEWNCEPWMGPPSKWSFVFGKLAMVVLFGVLPIGFPLVLLHRCCCRARRRPKAKTA